jgi:diguanylate cyclase (GGDEF)-like protein
MTEKSDQLLALFEPHRSFTRIFQDAYALVSADGHVLRYNQAFCTLTGKKAFELKRNVRFNDLLADPEPNGQLSALLHSNTPLRLDEIPILRVADSDTLQAIVTSFPYHDENQALLGVCLLLRDVTAESNLQGKYKQRHMESITDPLTKLYTRRYISSFMNDLRNRKDTSVEPDISVLLCDIDHFKSVNDNLGHGAGDHVLKLTAEVIRSQCRITDRVGRYGGEEFLVVLPNTTVHGACIVAEKIRRAVESADIQFEDKPVRVTISCGVAQLNGPSESDDELVHRADMGLYAAKKNGRNRSIVSRDTTYWTLDQDARPHREVSDSLTEPRPQSA